MARLQILSERRTSMLNQARYCSHMRSKKGQEIMAKEYFRNLPVMLLNFVRRKDIDQLQVLLKYEFTEATTDEERNKAASNLTMINAKRLLEDCTEPKVSLRARVDQFLKVNDTSGPLITDAGDCLLELLRARRGPELTVISWNAQLMNTTDRPDTQFENSMRKKSEEHCERHDRCGCTSSRHSRDTWATFEKIRSEVRMQRESPTKKYSTLRCTMS